MNAAASNPFPLPSQIRSLPGTEGWEEMYPYYARVRPEDDQRFWFYNSMHFPEPIPAFDVITAEVPYSGIGARKCWESRLSRRSAVPLAGSG